MTKYIAKIKIGEKKDGSPKIMKMDRLIYNELKKIKHMVHKKNFDYVALVAGLPGSGKSTLSRTLARYFCPWFDESYIAFTGDDFVDITNDCPEYSAVILDESFASLNSKVGMSSDFVKIINHLQLLRQKHLYLFLCLPNFFDLAKGIAIFRSSHLFVTYFNNDGDRGHFLVFDRDNKRKLYVKGNKYMEYNAQKANFHAKFWENQDILNVDRYEELKMEHLKQQNTDDIKKLHQKADRNEILWKLKNKFNWKVDDLAKLAGIDKRNVYRALKSYEKWAKLG